MGLGTRCYVKTNYLWGHKLHEFPHHFVSFLPRRWKYHLQASQFDPKKHNKNFIAVKFFEEIPCTAYWSWILYEQQNILLRMIIIVHANFQPVGSKLGYLESIWIILYFFIISEYNRILEAFRCCLLNCQILIGKFPFKSGHEF